MAEEIALIERITVVCQSSRERYDFAQHKSAAATHMHSGLLIICIL